MGYFIVYLISFVFPYFTMKYLIKRDEKSEPLRDKLIVLALCVCPIINTLISFIVIVYLVSEEAKEIQIKNRWWW